MNKQRLTLILAILIIGSMSKILAQSSSIQPLPIDTQVRYGKLDNGLTYYIRHNELPKDRAEFFIAQKVGSILEQDNQVGLAHFLEHMAFNGTKNLPEKTMINYLETIGVKFGENLNAYTGFDETVYNISNVPLTRSGIIDTCLLVLHDWSGFLSLSDKEIDKERGVIREEMRTRNSANYRQIEKILPQIMPGSQYASRFPIGTEEIIMNFKPNELRDYYHKWYRPDLQGIIVVGDIDVDKIEAKIKTMFADIPKPVNAAERIYYPVPNNEEPIVGIVTDKEATNTQVAIYYKHDPLPDDQAASAVGLVSDYFNKVISNMMNERFNEMVQKADPPFVYAMSMDGPFIVAQTKDALTFIGISRENETEKTITALTQEIERVKKYGFTASEYDRARTNVLKSYEAAFNEKGKQRNSNYCQEYVEHFTKGGYIPGIETEYNMINQIAPNLSVQQVNKYIEQLIGEKNTVLSLSGPEKEGLVYPSKEDLLSWYNKAQKADVKPYEDKVSNEPLISNLPKPGKIKSTTPESKFDATTFTLSNGIKIVVKPTTFKDDEILMAASSPGGSSLFPETDTVNIKIYGSVVELGGVGNFSDVELRKVLTGKTVSVSPTISTTAEGFSGSSSTKDFETMLQLIYLYATAPRMDQDAYGSFLNRMKSMLQSKEVDPSVALADTINNALYQSTARVGRLKASELEKANYQTIMNWYKDRYKDMNDFTFVFVGNIDVEKAKPLFEQYLGSLPAGNRKETFKPVNLSYKKNIYKTSFSQPMQAPKTTVFDVYSGTLEPTLPNRMKFSMLSQILNIVYTEKVREDESGTYGVRTSGSISNYPKGQSSLQIYFDTNAEKRDLLKDIIHRELNNVATQGPRQEDFDKVKEFMLKKQKENLQENNYWAGTILNFYQLGYDGYSGYETTLNAITPADIKTFTKSFLDQKNMIEIIMNGVKAE